MQSLRPLRVLVVGGTGNVGKGILTVANTLQSDSVEFCATYRSTESKLKLEKLFPAVRPIALDLDKFEDFAVALSGVSRLVILTGYTSKMLIQCKTLVDAAKVAGVSHIIHVGVMARDDTTLPTFGWHIMIEKYIEASGIAFTHVRPAVYMQTLLGYPGIEKEAGVVQLYWTPNYRLTWVDAEEVGEAVAIVAKDATRYIGRVLWFSSDSASMQEVTDLIAANIGKPIKYNFIQPTTWADIATRLSGDRPHMEGIAMAFQRHNDGSFSEDWKVYPDLADTLGRQPSKCAAFVKNHAAIWSY